MREHLVFVVSAITACLSMLLHQYPRISVIYTVYENWKFFQLYW